jgi:hypothetical protein
MRRKLIKQGVEALTVTLPAKWLKEKGLGAGDEVDIDDKDSGLYISGVGKGMQKSKTINIETTHPKYVRSVVASAYKAGYDEIMLNFKSVPKTNEINAIVNSFTGLEVVTTAKDSITIKCFLRTEEKEVENLILKMFQLVKMLLEDMDTGWHKVDADAMENIVETNMRKLRDHCLRTIRATGHGGEKSYDYYDLVTQLEKMAVTIKELAQFISTAKPKKTALFSQISGSFDEYYKAYLKKDPISANSVWVKHHKSIEEHISPKNLPKLFRNDNPALVAYYYELMLRLLQIGSRILSIIS